MEEFFSKKNKKGVIFSFAFFHIIPYFNIFRSIAPDIPVKLTRYTYQTQMPIQINDVDYTPYMYILSDFPGKFPA